MAQGTIKVPITFHVYAGEEVARSETLARDVIKVGKLESSHLRLDDESVSRMHAVIEVASADDIHLIDLGSASGTFVNGRKINKTKLESGDQIQFGAVIVGVEIGEAYEDAGAASLPPAAGVAPVSGFGAPAAQVTPTFAAAMQPAAALPNPFAKQADVPAFGAAAQAPSEESYDDSEYTGEVMYQLIPSGPAVNPAEVDSHESAVEVVIMWGDLSILHVAHLSPPRSFYVGEATDSKGKVSTDFLIGSEVLNNAERLPVTVEAGAGVAVVIPQGAYGDVTVGEQQMTFEDLAASNQLQACNELAGAKQYPLPAGATARVVYNGFTFVVRPVPAGQRIGIGGAPKIDWKQYIWTIASILVHTAFLLMFYFLPPSAASLSLDLLNADSRLVQYLIEAPETVEEELPEFLEENKEDDEGGKGKRHKDEEGQMGKKDEQKTKNKFGIEGPQDNEDPHMAREEAKEMAANAGIIGILKASVGSWNSPTSPYGRDTALGADPMSALGALMGDQIGSNFGFGGLGLRGTGRGGGGTGEGTIGLGNIGTIGHGAGGGTGSGYGRGAGGFHGRDAKVPRIRTGNADVRGSLSKEVIRRIIRRHINEVRFCYEQELNARPDLEGRVSVKFIISPTGAVQTAVVADSSLGNAKAEQCISQSVLRWTFPAPDGGGIVVVTYPFVLSQSGGGEE